MELGVWRPVQEAMAATDMKGVVVDQGALEHLSQVVRSTAGSDALVELTGVHFGRRSYAEFLTELFEKVAAGEVDLQRALSSS
jgi:hypothetical protein